MKLSELSLMKGREIKYSIPVKQVQITWQEPVLDKHTTRATLKMTIFQRYAITTFKLTERKCLQRLQLYDES